MSTTSNARPLAGDRLIDREEFRQIVGWKPGVIEMKETRGHDMPARFKLGRSVRYRESEVLAWIEKNRVAAPTAGLAC